MGDAIQPGDLQYKCRRCDAIYQSLSTPDVTMTLVSVLTGTPDPNASGISARWHGFHSCADGGLGISDLIGGASRSKGAANG